MKQVSFSIFRKVLSLILGLFLSVSAFAQITVKGQVKDSQGDGIIGANVSEVGTTNGTITDFDGNFVLNCKKGAQLTISFVGYVSQTLQATSNMVVVLQEDAKSLQDVVVIGYGVAKKNDLTGSVTALKPDALNKGLTTNPQDMLQGKIAGVNVTSKGGAPGEGATIRIRGGASLNASNDPLIVIDGLALDNQGVKGLANPLSMVNPADIESFTVLKDASATAIYGSRGSNGVIIITTKKGRKASAPQITYNGNVSLSTRSGEVDVMDANEYRAFIKSYYGADSDAYKLLGNANTDWQDEVYRTALSHDHNLTVSGGLKNVPYRVSLGYTDQQGILKTSDFKRYTASLSLSPSLFENHLTANFNGKFMKADTDYANTEAIGAAVRMDPTQPITSSDPKYKNFAGYFQWLDNGSALNDPNWVNTANSKSVGNPVSLLNLYDKYSKSYAYIGSLDLDYKVHGFEDLRLHAGASGNRSNGKETTSIPISSYSNTYYGWDGYEKENKYSYTFTGWMQYYKDFNDANHLDVMAGYEYSRTKYWGDKYGCGYYQKTNNDESLRGKATNINAKPWASENRLQSFYGRLNYSLLDRYLLTATVRRDGSSRFKQHYATFPAFAFAWKINEEGFLKDVEDVSEIKLRLGWGKTGQQEGIGDYNYFTSYNVSTIASAYYPVYGNGTLYRPNAYNSDLKWETTATYNAGLDFGFFYNRLNFSVDYYFRKTTDLINTAPVSAGSNFRNQVTKNIGSMENKGIEISATVKPIVKNDMYWEISANMTYNDNKITELTGDASIVQAKDGGISAGTGNVAQYHTVGKPARSYWVYQQVYDENRMPIEGLYVDRNGDGQITTEDRYFYKSASAPFTFGFATRFQYKNWDLGCSFRGSIGNYVFNDREAGFVNVAKTYDSSFNYTHNILKKSAETNWCTYDNVLSDYFVQNASFLKCDNITLGYSFNNLFKAAKYKGVSGRIYVAASNVFTITKYDGLDPEVEGGIDNNIYPRPFNTMLGLSLNF